MKIYASLTLSALTAIAILTVLLSGCSTCPCNQAQLDATTETVKQIQMNRYDGFIVDNREAQ